MCRPWAAEPDPPASAAARILPGAGSNRPPMAAAKDRSSFGRVGSASAGVSASAFSLGRPARARAKSALSRLSAAASARSITLSRSAVSGFADGREITVQYLEVARERADRRLALLRFTGRRDALLPHLLKLGDELLRRIRCPCRRGRAQGGRRD